MVGVKGFEKSNKEEQIRNARKQEEERRRRRIKKKGRYRKEKWRKEQEHTPGDI